jgi:hypothetical protein
VRNIREVLRLKGEARLSDRQIAAVLGSARSTVQDGLGFRPVMCRALLCSLKLFSLEARACKWAQEAD